VLSTCFLFRITITISYQTNWTPESASFQYP
jgi:hypothetical protein